jgi:hypothetical protein
MSLLKINRDIFFDANDDEKSEIMILKLIGDMWLAVFV